METTKIGIVGCGAISGIYFETAKRLEILEVAACADILLDRAKGAAERHGVAKGCSVEELLTDPEIEIVVNLTVPQAHFEVAEAALLAGKSIYNEKPLALTREEGKRLLSLAKEKGLRVGGAPDTFLGSAIQTCRKLIDDGWIGTPIGATAFMTCHGHESWHPAPEFYYKAGGGPMFDMGPYYLTALVSLIGPVARVTGMTRTTFPTRTITSQPLKGTVITVDTPTHIAGVMQFANGAIGTILTSFDVWKANLPRIEIYGTEGSLSVPDPNTFGEMGGPILLSRRGGEWREVPAAFPYFKNSRCLGVADMAAAIRAARPHRANAELTYHVLDLMHAFHDAMNQGAFIDLESTCSRPAPMPIDLPEDAID